jgi:hypothetical protein
MFTHAHKKENDRLFGSDNVEQEKPRADMLSMLDDEK